MFPISTSGASTTTTAGVSSDSVEGVDEGLFANLFKGLTESEGELSRLDSLMQKFESGELDLAALEGDASSFRALGWLKEQQQQGNVLPGELNVDTQTMEKAESVLQILSHFSSRQEESLSTESSVNGDELPADTEGDQEPVADMADSKLIFGGSEAVIAEQKLVDHEGDFDLAGENELELEGASELFVTGLRTGKLHTNEVEWNESNRNLQPEDVYPAHGSEQQVVSGELFRQGQSQDESALQLSSQSNEKVAPNGASKLSAQFVSNDLTSQASSSDPDDAKLPKVEPVQVEQQVIPPDSAKNSTDAVALNASEEFIAVDKFAAKTESSGEAKAVVSTPEVKGSDSVDSSTAKKESPHTSQIAGHSSHARLEVADQNSLLSQMNSLGGKPIAEAELSSLAQAQQVNKTDGTASVQANNTLSFSQLKAPVDREASSVIVNQTKGPFEASRAPLQQNIAPDMSGTTQEEVDELETESDSMVKPSLVSPNLHSDANGKREEVKQGQSPLFASTTVQQAAINSKNNNEEPVADDGIHLAEDAQEQASLHVGQQESSQTERERVLARLHSLGGMAGLAPQAEPEHSTSLHHSHTAHQAEIKAAAQVQESNFTQQLAQAQEKLQLLQDKLAPMLGQRLMMMMDQKEQEAEIQLDPPELGSLMVRVQVKNDQAHVSFVAQHPQAKDALEQAMPRLRDLMQQQQMELVNAEVSYQQREQGGQQGQQSGHQSQDSQLIGQEKSSEEQLSSQQQQIILQAGKVDFYA